jgi:ketosteroid isomerase-like protein
MIAVHLIRVVAVAAACGFAGPCLAQDPSLPAVAQANRAFDDALSRRDLHAVDLSWLQDAQVTAVHPNGRPPAIGWEAVRKSWEAAFLNFPELSVTMSRPIVRVMGNVAVVVGTEAVRGKRPDGTAVEFEASTTNVFELRDGRWLMVHHQASRIPQ